jgi:bifunctional enzyme CysN/CysC
MTIANTPRNIFPTALEPADDGDSACALWFTGLSGAGKSTIAQAVLRQLRTAGRRGYLLDGDNLRAGLNSDLGFSQEDRAENQRRVAEVARLFVDAGMVAIVATISPLQAMREMARKTIGATRFIEIYIDTPKQVCEQRDPKQLYKNARQGLVKNFTGVDSRYEPPEQPDLRLDTTALSADACAERVVALLADRGLLAVPSRTTA